MKKSRFINAITIFLLLIRSVSTADASSDATPLLSCRLQHSQVRAGEKTVLFVEVQEIADLYGYQFELYFAKEKVSLLDGEIERSGINFKLGDFLSPDFVVMNDVNGDSGRTNLALTQMDPSKPRSGSGILARIEVQALEPGESQFTFNNVILAASSAEKIAHSLQGCALQVLPSSQTSQPSSITPTTNTVQATLEAQATSSTTDTILTSTPAVDGKLYKSLSSTDSLPEAKSLPSNSVTAKEPDISPTQLETELPLGESIALAKDGAVETPSGGTLVTLSLGLGALILVTIAFLIRKLR